MQKETARLIVRLGVQPEEEHVLTKAVTTLGREAVNDIVLSDSEVSRRHARILEQNGEYRIEDLGSTNGSSVNGKRATEPTLLYHGDTVELGESVSIVFLQTYMAPAEDAATQLVPPVVEDPPTTQDFGDQLVDSTPPVVPPAVIPPLPSAPPPAVESASISQKDTDPDALFKPPTNRDPEPYQDPAPSPARPSYRDEPPIYREDPATYADEPSYRSGGRYERDRSYDRDRGYDRDYDISEPVNDDADIYYDAPDDDRVMVPPESADSRRFGCRQVVLGCGCLGLLLFFLIVATIVLLDFFAADLLYCGPFDGLWQLFNPILSLLGLEITCPI